MSSPPAKERLLQLLDYVQYVVRLPERERFSVKDSASFVYFQDMLHDRIGVETDLTGEQGRVWMKLARLKRIDPPEPAERLKPYLSMYKNPARSPKILDDRVETMTEAEGKRLLADGVVSARDITRLRKRGPKKEKLVKVKLRLQKDGEISEEIGRYIAGPWQRWAQMEKPRRATMKIYDDFFKLHQSIESGAVEAPVEVIWGVGVGVWKSANGVIKHPLIEALVEIEIDPANQDILVRPRAAGPQLFIKPFLWVDSPGLMTLQDKAEEYFADLGRNVELEFSPFDPTSFEPLLRLATSLLSSSAEYYPDLADHPKGPELPVASETLRITDTWAIYARPRSDNLFVEDIERLKEVVAGADFDSLPTAARRFVADPSDQPRYQPQSVDLMGAGRRSGAGEAAAEGGESPAEQPELFFPKEFNDAQVRIIRELERSEGVVVQGPPGTGKTHTIANIICHYLATGRRVLVTSQGEPALKVLQGFIPQEIRGLTISLLTREREGLQQLETAVTLLANEVSRIDPKRIEQEILEGEAKLRDIRDRLAANEQAVREIAERQLEPIPCDLLGKKGRYPAELAAMMLENREDHGWLPDDPSTDPACDPEFTAADVAAARQARIRLGDDLRYLTHVVPEIGDLPDNRTIQSIHERIVEADQNDPYADDPEFPKLSVLAGNAVGRVETLIERLREMEQLLEWAEGTPWVGPMLQAWIDRDFGIPEIEPLLPDLQWLAERVPLFADRPVGLPELGDEEQVVRDAIARSVKRQRPFGTIAIGVAEAKRLFAEITVEGEPPSGADAWRHVEEYLAFRTFADEVADRWNEVAETLGLPSVGDTGEAAAGFLAEYFDLIGRVQSFEPVIAELRAEIPELFPHGIDPVAVCVDLAANRRAIEVASVNLARNGRADARKTVEELLARLQKCEGPIVDKACGILRGRIGDHAVLTNEISNEWDALLADLSRIHAHARDFDMVRKLADLVEQAGGRRWADALRTDPAKGEEDPWTPGHALESWSWKRLATYLHQIDGRQPMRDLAAARQALEAEHQETLTEIVRLRTFLGLYINMTDLAKSALVRFTSAIRQIGSKGEGSRARRYKRNAQEAMNDCYTAVPCWIMPTWRVSETLPPVIGSFDLVIIDEASQSDILALPTLLRGARLLIVGDDKQVSPIAPFVEERKLVQLRRQHLGGQIFGDLMMPGTSLYDLANAVFPGKRVMLDEHFRCAEPIIRFSFRFYPEKIIPVRIPKASERLQPPLIDVYLPHGARDKKKKINRAEANAIVDEIERLVNDPLFAGRSIGVLALIGDQQGAFIQNLLLRRIGQERYLAHQIDCGDSATFQGRERDIMFVSMVTSKGRIAPQTAVIYEQRFNVAMSRARDRMYLYRSVSVDDLNPNDLKAKVIQHFAQPMGPPQEAGKQSTTHAADRCETDLEREVFGYLAEAGYRVAPHISVGHHSIDMVVEGAGDRRLAVELDGDRRQTADQWLAAWSRHKVLERVGWRTWRCWAASFALDREACLQDLLDTLASLEIEPIGQAQTDDGFVEHRTLSPEDVVQDKAEEEQALILVEGEEGPEVERVIEVGDRVLVSYSDDPARYHTLRISETDHDPENGVIKADDILAMALIGAGIGEEVEAPFNSDVLRVVTIFEIEKPGAQVSLVTSQ